MPSVSTLSEALRRKDFAIIFDWFSFWFLCGTLISLATIAFAANISGPPGSGMRVTAFAIVFSFACTVCGWILGLLFGIPRTLARPLPAVTPLADGATSNGNAAAPAMNRVNTNLEDISDWLTKTLVGVGLTQLYLVPHYLWTAADKINRAGLGWDQHGQLLALALFLYFAPGGFWLGYIGTRTILTKLFDSLEGPTQSQVNAALSKDALKLDVKGGEIAGAASAVIAAADSALLALPITSLNSPRELGAWGAAKARAREYAVAAFALEQATRADPTDAELADALGKVYLVLHRTEDATNVLKEQPASEATMLAALYEDSETGVERALKAGTALSKQRGAEKNLNLHVWMACAYGQQRKQAKDRGDEQLAEAARANAIKEVEIALSIDAAAAKPWLRSLWLATPGPNSDDDLSSIPSDDPELKQLLQ